MKIFRLQTEAQFLVSIQRILTTTDILKKGRRTFKQVFIPASVAAIYYNIVYECVIITS